MYFVGVSVAWLPSARCASAAARPPPPRRAATSSAGAASPRGASTTGRPGPRLRVAILCVCHPPCNVITPVCLDPLPHGPVSGPPSRVWSFEQCLDRARIVIGLLPPPKLLDACIIVVFPL